MLRQVQDSSEAHVAALYWSFSALKDYAETILMQRFRSTPMQEKYASVRETMQRDVSMACPMPSPRMVASAASPAIPVVLADGNRGKSLAAPALSSRSADSAPAAILSTPVAILSATSTLTAISAATSVPVAIPTGTLVPLTIPAATAVPRTIPAATAVPATIPAAISIPRTIPATTAVPSTIPAAISIPPTIPSATAVPATILG